MTHFAKIQQPSASSLAGLESNSPFSSTTYDVHFIPVKRLAVIMGTNSHLVISGLSAEPRPPKPTQINASLFPDPLMDVR